MGSLIVKYLVIAGAGAGIVTGIYLYGVNTGVTKGKVEQLEATVKAERDRKNVDKDVDGLSDRDICLRLGGMLDECSQLRGLDPSP